MRRAARTTLPLSDAVVIRLNGGDGGAAAAAAAAAVAARWFSRTEVLSLLAANGGGGSAGTAIAGRPFSVPGRAAIAHSILFEWLRAGTDPAAAAAAAAAAK